MDAKPGTPSASSSMAQKLLGYVPVWILTNIRSKRSLKTFARSWLAAWVSVILLLPNASLQTMGNTAFFAMLMGTAFLPAAYPAPVFLVLLFTTVAGSCTGWALGAAAMRAALAARDKVELQSTLLKAQESAAGFANPDVVFKAEIFQGIFLDARSSIVFGCFLGTGTFFFAVVRSYVPFLTAYSIFGTIALDIFCTFGPLFPAPSYFILNSLLTCIGMYGALALFLTLFLFPESVNHAYLSLVCRLLDVIKGLLALTDKVFAQPTEAGPHIEKLLTMRLAMFKILTGLRVQGTFLNAEFTWGRLSGEDVAGLQPALTAVATRVNAMLTTLKITRKIHRKGLFPNAPTSGDDDAPSGKSSTMADQDPTSETFLAREWRARLEIQEDHRLTLTHVAPVLNAATEDLRLATLQGVVAVREALAFVNGNRFGFFRKGGGALSTHDQKLDEAIDTLRQALQQFEISKRLDILQPYLREFGAETGDYAYLPSLRMTHVFSATFVIVAEATLALMEYVGGLLSKRKRSRLWAPKSLRDMARAFANDEVEEEEKIAEDAQEEVGRDDYLGYRRDPDSQPATNVLQKFFRCFQALYRWSTTSKGVFVARYTFLSVAIWLPAVFRTSANFYYEQKGVWALIMAQVSLGYFLGDQLFNYFTRVVVTFLGLIVGLLIWYIGDGDGTGSPYGIAASTAVFLVPLVFVRIFAPVDLLPIVLLLNATVTLIVGYSWIDGHLSVISIGIGWGVAWRRMLLVLIGCTCSFFIQFLPPKSARKAVRVRTAAVMTGLSNVYLGLMSAWIGDGTLTLGPNKRGNLEQSERHFRGQLIMIATQLTTLDTLTENAWWEGNIVGKWSYEEYKEIHVIERDMLALMVQLGTALLHINDEWRRKLLHETQVVNPNFISDFVSLFSIVAQSLRVGEPIHTVVPRDLLDKLFSRHYIAPQPARPSRNFIEDVREYDYLFFMTAIVASLELATCLDELHSYTRQLCGEVPFRGFDEWKAVHYKAIHGSSKLPAKNASAEAAKRSDDSVDEEKR